MTVSTPALPTQLSDTRRRVRGPFTRWPRAADAVLALVVFVATVLTAEGPDDSLVFRPIGDVALPALLLFAVAGAALYWRRRAPLPVLGVVLLAWAVTVGTVYNDLGGMAIVALYSAGRYGDDDRKGHLGVAAAVALMIAGGLTGKGSWGGIAFGVLVMCVAWYVGQRLRLSRERAEQLLRQQRTEARRIVAEERARIARELHDVVAHRVSLMTVQAGAAKTVAVDDPAGAQQAMGAVETAGRQALDELRHLLDVLRPDADLDLTAPQPGLADLPQLVEQTRAVGVDVTLATDGLPAALPARVELSAYRIVQECLTNVVKHAGPHASTEVRLTSDGSCVVVEVTDDGRGSTVLPGSRHGVIGMRERALLLGGSLDVGPRPAGGFGVVARLPIAGVPA